jgi:DNA replication and repair protein RecF
MKHSLFGAHLDDFIIQFESKSARRLASRGQQKLIITLLKMAQVRHITRHKGPLLFLIDDFITDFDSATLQRLFPLLRDLECQLIITTPTAHNAVSASLQELGAVSLSLSL